MDGVELPKHVAKREAAVLITNLAFVVLLGVTIKQVFNSSVH